MSAVEASLATAVLSGTPLLYAALGELLSEKAGTINIGLDGMMLIGAMVGFMVAFDSGSIVLGLFGGAGAGLVFALIFFALPVLAFRADQILVGFALWLLGLGLSAQVGQDYAGRTLHVNMAELKIPLLHEIPFVGTILFEQVWPVYAGVLVALAAAYILRRTRYGLNLRAVGEDSSAAYAMGLNVEVWRAAHIALGGLLAGFGGAMLSTIIAATWREEMTAGRGWVALALVIFAAWRPISLILASLLFGFFLILSNLGQIYDWGIPSSILGMAPYVVTLVILGARSWFELKRGARPRVPGGLGVPFVRGSR